MSNPINYKKSLSKIPHFCSVKYIKLSEKDRQTVEQMYESHSKSQIRERCHATIHG